MPSLFAPTFDRLGVGEDFTPQRLVSHMIRFEAELARLVGSNPLAEVLAELAIDVSEKADGGDGPLATLLSPAAAAAGNPAVPLVGWLRTWLTDQCRADSELNALHFGATSQDVLDSALMCSTRDASEKIRSSALATTLALLDLADVHAETPDAGRSLMQTAWPVTFGWRTAHWALGLHEALIRLNYLDYFVQYGGAVGTMAASVRHSQSPHTAGSGASNTAGSSASPVTVPEPLEIDGATLRQGLAKAMGLQDPGATWHTRRQVIADHAHALASLSGAVGKIAQDLVLLAQTELGGIAESNPGGSSAMPHKRNPIASISARACALRAPHLAAALYAAMPQEFERGAGSWHSEWEPLCQLWTHTGSALAWLQQAVTGLTVFDEALAQSATPAEASFAEAVPGVSAYLAAATETRRIASELRSTLSTQSKSTHAT